MKVQVVLEGAAADGVNPELVTARLAHALVGVVEAHASQVEHAARRTGAGPEDLAEVALMVSCPRSSADSRTVSGLPEQLSRQPNR